MAKISIAQLETLHNQATELIRSIKGVAIFDVDAAQVRDLVEGWRSAVKEMSEAIDTIERVNDAWEKEGWV